MTKLRFFSCQFDQSYSSYLNLTKLRFFSSQFDQTQIIPKLIHGGGWLVRKAVGSKPAVVANALEQAQYAGDGYVEIDIDVEVSIPPYPTSPNPLSPNKPGYKRIK